MKTYLVIFCMPAPAFPASAQTAFQRFDTNGDEPVSVAVRDDAMGKWTISTLAHSTGGSPGRRARVDDAHRRQHRPPPLFTGAGDGHVYRGAYDPPAPGDLKWEVDPGQAKTARFVAGFLARRYRQSRDEILLRILCRDC